MYCSNLGLRLKNKSRYLSHTNMAPGAPPSTKTIAEEPLPSPSRLRVAPWTVRRWTNGERCKLAKGGTELSVKCAPHAQGTDSGTGMFATPIGFPAGEVTVSYEVFFPDDFTWVKGGKVGFGIGIGDGLETASGGDWKKTAGSIRTMWRDDGQAIGYLYIPLEGAKRDDVIRAQSVAFEKAARNATGKGTGIDMWHKDEPKPLQFKKGAWNTVTISAKLNAPGKANGKYALTVNGATKSLDDVVFRKSADIRFNGVMMSTFFGGSTLEWACKTPQTITFKNLIVRTK